MNSGRLKSKLTVCSLLFDLGQPSKLGSANDIRSSGSLADRLQRLRRATSRDNNGLQEANIVAPRDTLKLSPEKNFQATLKVKSKIPQDIGTPVGAMLRVKIN